MNSSRADALGLILPFAPRTATEDFFGLEDALRFVEVAFGLEDALRVRVEADGCHFMLPSCCLFRCRMTLLKFGFDPLDGPRRTR